MVVNPCGKSFVHALEIKPECLYYCVARRSQLVQCVQFDKCTTIHTLTGGISDELDRLYTKVPPNGLVIYCGTIVTEEGKEKRMNLDFEPFKPINTSLYLCDNKFHTEVRWNVSIIGTWTCLS